MGVGRKEKSASEASRGKTGLFRPIPTREPVHKLLNIPHQSRLAISSWLPRETLEQWNESGPLYETANQKKKYFILFP